MPISDIENRKLILGFFDNLLTFYGLVEGHKVLQRELCHALRSINPTTVRNGIRQESRIVQPEHYWKLSSVEFKFLLLLDTCPDVNVSFGALVEVNLGKVTELHITATWV